MPRSEATAGAGGASSGSAGGGKVADAGAGAVARQGSAGLGGVGSSPGAGGDTTSGTGSAPNGAAGSAGAPDPTNPIIGTWHEEARYDCETGDEIPADTAPINEVVFDDPGSFSVTWTPFEWYQDYEGTYVVDLDAGTLEMTISTSSSNYVPADTDLSGTFQVDNGTSLILQDIWFGIDQEATATPACGHRLVRN